MSAPHQEPTPEHNQERAEENFRRLEEALSSRLPVKRQPHLGYALPLIVSVYLILSLAAVAYLYLGIHFHLLPADAAQHLQELHKLTLFSMGTGYFLTLLWTYLVYPLFWHRPYFDVLQWNAASARKYWKQICGGAVGLYVAVALAGKFVTIPDKMPMDAFLKNASVVWLLAFFGSLVAPFFEELIFRGYLLPGVAIAFDWLRLARTDDARAHWESSDTVSTQAIVFSTIVTGIGFAALHAAEYGYAWGLVFLLFCVSCVLSAVRVRLRSLAASVLLHSVYNGTQFVLFFFATSGFRHFENMTH